jgi:hypothetical protein
VPSARRQTALHAVGRHLGVGGDLAELGDALRIDHADDQLEVMPVLRDEVGYGGPLIEVLHAWPSHR